MLTYTPLWCPDSFTSNAHATSVAHSTITIYSSSEGQLADGRYILVSLKKSY